MTSTYKTGIVYRIEYKQDPSIRYVGSTLNELKYRWRDHKQNFNTWVNGTGGTVSIYPYFQQYGIDNFIINEIKTYSVCDRKHLQVYEQLWVNKLTCVNKSSPFGLVCRVKPLRAKQKKKYNEENKEARAERDKKYREEHREVLAEEKKKYYQDNKEAVLEKRKKYREENKEAIVKYREEHKEVIAEKAKEKYEKNKEAVLEKRKKEKVLCLVCKTEGRRDCIRQHERSKKHQDNLTRL
jgi:hypothetical protein